MNGAEAVFRGEFLYFDRADMDRAVIDAVLDCIIPAGVLRVTAPGHGAVITDVREGVRTPRRIVGKHRIGTERALTTKG